MSIHSVMGVVRRLGGGVIGSCGIGFKPISDEVDDLDVGVVLPEVTPAAVWDLAALVQAALHPNAEARVEAYPKVLVVVLRCGAQSVDVNIYADAEYGRAVLAAYHTARGFLAALPEDERRHEDARRMRAKAHPATYEAWYRSWNIPTSGRL